MRKIQKRSECPISYALDILGDKWILLILRDMVFENKHFYKEFLDSGEGIATNVLSDRLKILEQKKIIKSKPYILKKSMKYYWLTELGIDLIPSLIEFWTWGAKYDPETKINKKELERRVASKQEIIEQFKNKARKLL